MLPKYCTVCGKELVVSVFRGDVVHYDAYTGKAYTETITTSKCEDYQEGYSDKLWHIHDRHVTVERQPLTDS